MYIGINTPTCLKDCAIGPYPWGLHFNYSHFSPHKMPSLFPCLKWPAIWGLITPTHFIFLSFLVSSSSSSLPFPTNSRRINEGAWRPTNFFKNQDLRSKRIKLGEARSHIQELRDSHLFLFSSHSLEF